MIKTKKNVIELKETIAKKGMMKTSKLKEMITKKGATTTKKRQLPQKGMIKGGGKKATKLKEDNHKEGDNQD
jgi:hypothetical protein